MIACDRLYRRQCCMWYIDSRYRTILLFLTRGTMTRGGMEVCLLPSSGGSGDLMRQKINNMYLFITDS